MALISIKYYSDNKLEDKEIDLKGEQLEILMKCLSEVWAIEYVVYSPDPDLTIVYEAGKKRLYETM